jgi:hypothetical protein
MVPFVVAKKLGQGVNNPVVARLTLQNLEILRHCAITEETKEKVQKLYLDELTPKLLRCSQIYEKLRAETEKLASSYKPPGRGAVSVELPQVMELEEECRNYVAEATSFLQSLLQVFNLLFGTSFTEASEWTIPRKPNPSVVGYAEANFQKQPDHIRYLQQLARCTEPFVRLRNAAFHPGGFNGNLVVRNFRFEPDGTLAAPDWRREKDGKTEYGPVSIVEDMCVGVHNLLALGEDILVMWAVDHAAMPGLMEMSVIPENARNPACPIKYKMSLQQGILREFVGQTARASDGGGVRPGGARA